jgi:hypothetical protein
LSGRDGVEHLLKMRDTQWRVQQFGDAIAGPPASKSDIVRSADGRCRQHIAGGEEGGLPCPVHQLCVPPNVIKMQMRIDDVIDISRERKSVCRLSLPLA